MILAELDVDLVLNIIASSDGDFPLATERLNGKLKLPYGTIKEYELQEFLAGIDTASADRLSTKLRGILIVKLYGLIHQATSLLTENLGNLRPAELARTHASLVNSFSALTAPATKITFDYDNEITQLATEFGISSEEVKQEIKSIEQRAKTGFGTVKK